MTFIIQERAKVRRMKGDDKLLYYEREAEVAGTLAILSLKICRRYVLYIPTALGGGRVHTTPYCSASAHFCM